MSERKYEHVNYGIAMRLESADPLWWDDIFVAIFFHSWLHFGYYTRPIDPAFALIFPLHKLRERFTR